MLDPGKASQGRAAPPTLLVNFQNWWDWHTGYFLPEQRQCCNLRHSSVNFRPLPPSQCLLANVKRRKLVLGLSPHTTVFLFVFFLPKAVLQGTLEGGRRHGRQRKCWMDKVEEWTSLPMPELFTMASRRTDWKRTSAESHFVGTAYLKTDVNPVHRHHLC